MAWTAASCSSRPLVAFVVGVGVGVGDVCYCFLLLTMLLSSLVLCYFFSHELSVSLLLRVDFFFLTYLVGIPSLICTSYLVPGTYVSLPTHVLAFLHFFFVPSCLRFVVFSPPAGPRRVGAAERPVRLQRGRLLPRSACPALRQFRLSGRSALASVCTMHPAVACVLSECASSYFSVFGALVTLQSLDRWSIRMS